MPLISVVTIAYRPGYIDSMVNALQNQIMPKNQFQWVLTDELHHMRASEVTNFIGDSLNFKHIALEPVPYSNTAHAINIALQHCDGELVYFMADYSHPHPRCLQRQWEIYQKYGPKVFISGPLLDRLTTQGKSYWIDGVAVNHVVKVGDKSIGYVEHMPPIEIPLTDNYETPSSDNMISIFREPFIPICPSFFPPDARAGSISSVSIERGLYESMETKTQWFYCGRNDSAPLAVFQAIGGFPLPSVKGQHGGMDADLEKLMRAYGCRYLVDRLAPCYILPHPFRKPEMEFNVV